MAISVVLSQSPRLSPERQSLEGDLVAGLLMEDGLEVNVIPHIEQLQPGDTGLLCLEGITAHLVLLSWLSPLEAYRAARHRQVSGRFGRTCQTRVAPAEVAEITHPRALYSLDLAQFADAAACRQEIRRIRDESSQQVFTLGPGSIGAASSGGSESTASTEDLSDASPPPPAPPIQAAGELRVPIERHDEDDSDLERRLDGLVDELDQLDI